MHDIRLIRDDPAGFAAAMARRGVHFDAEEILTIDQKLRHARAVSEKLESERKKLAALCYRGAVDQIANQVANRQISFFNKEEEKAAVSRLAAEMSRGPGRALEQSPEYHLAASRIDVDALSNKLEQILAALPNLPAADVPDGADEDDNLLVAEHGTPPRFDFPVREHDAIGPALGLDFQTGAAIAGARFTLVRGAAARLHRALGQFGLDVLTRDHGYEEVVPPLLVRDEAVFGTAQLPKFAEDLFRTTDGRWLIPTSEVSLTNIVRERILAQAELPLRFTALTPCFRSEAGAAGRDTRGYIRQHQFEKAEMVSIVPPEQSEAEHERMTACAEDVLARLGLPFRRMKLCAGDLGFAAARTYDLEVWLPGQGRYREVSSCSTCGDFQARRMNARYRPDGEKGTRFVHTLNGSGLVVGRLLVAVVENGQRADGSVVVPAALGPYLGGQEVLTPA